MLGKKRDTATFEPGKDLVIPCACEWGKDAKKKCCKKFKKGKQCKRCPKR
jgi:hypothetical protein